MQVMYSIAELVKNYCVIYLVDTTEVPDFNTMYELYDPCTVMFFYRNKVRARHAARQSPRARTPARLPSARSTACALLRRRPHAAAHHD